MDIQTSNRPPAEEISLEELRTAAANSRWLIATFVLLCTLATGVIAWLTPKTYTATIVLAPSLDASSGDQLGKLGSLASQFGGLSSLTGLSFMGNSKEYESMAVLESEALTQNFIQQNHLLPVLFPKQWDAAAGRWKSSDPKRIPTLWKANRLFKGSIRAVTIDNKTGLITLTIKWRNAVQASDWANGLVQMANDYLRNKAIAEAERSIDFLNAQAAKTTLVESRGAIFALLEDELDKAMLARGSDEYAFKVLDPAFPPEKPSSLSVWVWMMAALIASSILSLLGVFFYVAWNKN